VEKEKKKKKARVHKKGGVQRHSPGDARNSAIIRAAAGLPEVEESIVVGLSTSELRNIPIILLTYQPPL
jgi:hypothetical protein